MATFYTDSASIDVLEVSSSLLVSGTLILSGSVSSQGGYTGSLLGTASWAENARTASFVTTAQTASYVLQAVSSSFATTASFAVSASWAPGGSGASDFPYTGSAIISGSLQVTGSVSSIGGFTGSLFGTASRANNAVTASYYQLVTGSAGTDVNIVTTPSGSIINMPDAGNGVRGLITADTQTIYGQKTFNGTIYTSISQFAGVGTTFGYGGANYGAFTNLSGKNFFGIDLGGFSYSFFDNVSYAYGINNFLSQGTFTAPSAGTWGLLTNVGIKGPTVTTSTGVVLNASALYISEASIGATNNYAIWVDSGSVRFDGDLIMSQSNVIVTGSVRSSGGFTGSLFGTASFATTSSFALNSNPFPFTGSAIISGSLNVIGSGSNIFVVSGTLGTLLNVSEKTASDTRLFTVSSASINLLTVNDDKSTRISGSLIVTGSITGSLLGTASFAVSASHAITASFALNAGAGSGFPFSGSAVITGSLLISGSEVRELEIIGDSYFTGSLFIANNIVAAQITGSVKAVDDISARSVGGSSVRGLQSAINALSSRISAVVGPASAQPTRYVSVANTIANNVLTGISGLTVSVSAGVIYEIDGRILYSVSAATGNAFGLIWPTANRVAGVWTGGISVNETGASTFSTMAFGNFDTGDSNSAIWSATVGAVGLHYIKVEGTIDAQTGGALYPLVRSSAAANTVVVARGSFFKLTRIN